MIENRIEREDSVATITSLNTVDSCSTLSPRSSDNNPDPIEHTVPREDPKRFPFISAHAHALRAYDVQAAHSDRNTSHTTSCVTLTLRWSLSPLSTALQVASGGSMHPSSGSLPPADREGAAKLVFSLSKETEALGADQRLAVVLDVNRDLIAKCHLLLHKQSKPNDQNEEDAAAVDKEPLCGVKPADLVCLPREGIQLVFYFTQLETQNHHNTNISSGPTAQRYLCRSFDVVSFTTDSGAALCGVPLKPYHRYHLKYTSRKGIELNLNKYAYLQLRVNSEAHLSEDENYSNEVKQNFELKNVHRGAKRPRKARTQGRSSGLFICAITETNGSAAKGGGSRAPRRSSRKRVTVQQTAPIYTTEYSSNDSFPSFSLDSGKIDKVPGIMDGPVMAPLLRRKRVLFTTGMRLSKVQERLCEGMGFIVNPSLSKARGASILVVQGPLMRSIKLLTLLPYIKALVDRKWLDDMLAQGNPLLPIEPYIYIENKRDGGIEQTNKFSIENTLSIPLEQRQRLFACHVFWIHPSAAPQDPPMNDLHTVLTASGGKISEKITRASVWVLPSRTPSTATMRLISKALSDDETANRRRRVRSTAVSNDDVPLSRLLSASVCMVVPDDIFRSVLQQQDLFKFTLRMSNVMSKLAVTKSKKQTCVSKQNASTWVPKVLST